MLSVLHIFLIILFFLSLFFFFNDTATTEIYTLSLHDALPIYSVRAHQQWRARTPQCRNRLPAPDRGGRTVPGKPVPAPRGDRKSTRLNSSHSSISYAVFCLKKKKNKKRT